MRGLLIVFEGLDRSGKTTQSDLLQQKLGSSKLMKFPDRSTSIGRLLDQFLTQNNSESLSNESVHLLFSANRWELRGEILRNLSNGLNVILDRYVYSGVAYSAGILGLDFKWCMNPDIGLPRPDVVLFIDVPMEVQAERFGFGKEFYERADMQSAVAHVFRKTADLDPDIWITIDGTKSVDTIHLEIVDAIEKKLAINRHEAVVGLWEDYHNCC